VDYKGKIFQNICIFIKNTNFYITKIIKDSVIAYSKIQLQQYNIIKKIKHNILHDRIILNMFVFIFSDYCYNINM
jgi:hypothetical protein